jgi:8-oxo-dGTP pyrophosphatase MutT (NUDIX family)
MEATARPAATVMLLRDGRAGIEVFMVVRHHAIDFASGALVFPGGRVEEADHDLAAGACPNPDGLGTEALAFRIAAIRETFEECGVLLARPHGSNRLVDAGALHRLEEQHRAALNAGSIGFDAVLESERLVPAPDLLVHFAHWITPMHNPRRFDTHFFALAAPEDQLAAHDGTESVESMWIAPRDVMAGSAAGRFKLVFATLMNLKRLDRNATVVEALQAAARAKVVTVMPELVARGEGNIRQMRIPAEAGYGGEVFTVDLPPA